MAPTMNVSEWNFLDWTLAGLVAFSTVRAAMTGFLRAIFSLVGSLAALRAATGASAGLGAWLVRIRAVDDLSAATTVAFTIIVLGVMGIFLVVDRGLRGKAKGLGVGGADRVAGGLFGLARGLVVGLAVIVGLHAAAADSDWLGESRLRDYFVSAGREVAFVLPTEISHDPDHATP